MPRTCTICNHPEHGAINGALVAGEAFRNIARRFGTSPAALYRHKKTDLPETLVKAARIAEVAQADTLLDRLKLLHRETAAILKEARTEGTKDNDLALKAIARVEKQLELEGRLLGQLAEQTKVSCQLVIYAPEMREESSYKTIDV